MFISYCLGGLEVRPRCWQVQFLQILHPEREGRKTLFLTCRCLPCHFVLPQQRGRERETERESVHACAQRQALCSIFFPSQKDSSSTVEALPS